MALSLAIKIYDISFVCMFAWFGSTYLSNLVHIFVNKAPNGYAITAASLFAAYGIYYFKDRIYEIVTGKKKEKTQNSAQNEVK